MLVSPAFAQATGGGFGGGLGAFLPLILIFVVFYFLLIRPQQKKAKAHRDMVGNVRRGDSVVTGGGIIGKVTKVMDERLQVEIADGVKVQIARGTLSDVVAKGQPVKDARSSKGNKKKRDDDDESDDASFDDDDGDES